MKLSGHLTPVVRRLLLGTALVISAAAAFSPEQDGTDTVIDSVERATEAVRERPQRKPALDLPEIIVVRSTKLDPEGDPFKTLSWKQEPPPQKPEPPPPPTAPPLPYRYLGQIEEGGNPILFLGTQENNFAVRVGETVENVWRLDSFANNRIEFTYLPLKLGQTMDVGGTH